jgi:hypothetical protein
MLNFKEKMNSLALLLIEEGSRACFAIAQSGRLHHQKNEVLPERAVALCLAGATPDTWKRVFRAFSEVSFPGVVALRGGMRDRKKCLDLSECGLSIP